MAEVVVRPGPGGGGEVVAQKGHLGLDVGAGSAQPQQGGPGLIATSVPGEPARGFREEEHPHGKHDAQDPAQPQHPSPGAVGRQGVADQIRAENPERDGQLVERHQRAALLGRGDFGQVERRQHGGPADTDAHQQPTGEEDGKVGRQGGHGRAGDEDHRGREQDGTAPEPVGQPPGERRAKRRAAQGDAGHDSQHQGREMGRCSQEQQRPRDDAGIIAEQQAAQGGCGRDK